MNTAILNLQDRMLAIVEQITLMAQELEVLKNDYQKLEDENSRLKTDIKFKLIDSAAQKPRESPQQYRGICIE